MKASSGIRRELELMRGILEVKEVGVFRKATSASSCSR
jgi:hypothetical protein